MSLVDERIAKGYSQKEMAEKLNLPYSTYNEYETGKKSIPLEVALKIADIIQKPIELLFLPVRFTIYEQNKKE